MKKKVVIVGGGFAGLAVAKTIGNCKDFDITLVDRRNYHLFQPLLYQVAMAGLSPAEIAAPIRSLMSDYKSVKVFIGNVESVDLKSKTIKADIGDLEYDYLVLACGAKHSYFGNEHWEPLAPGLKTLEQATEIRRRVLMAFEEAERIEDPTEQKKQLTFVVIGGGPTGVELAGAVGEISRYTLSKDFKNINSDNSRVILIEAGDRILKSFDPKLSRIAKRDLEKLGVQVWTNTRVDEVSEDGVKVGKEFLQAKTVLWAAGVQPSSINKHLGVELDRGNKAIVNADLSLPEYSNAFIIGDQAHVKGESGEALPGLAPVAIQQGNFVGQLLLDDLRSKPRKSFKYTDKGQMATIGRRKAVLQYGNIRMSGFLAWLAWLFVHIYYLIGFKNRLFVFLQWSWNYITYSRGARLITHREWRSFLKKDNS